MLIFLGQCLAVCISIAIGIVFVYGCCKAINRLFDGRGIPCKTISVKNFVSPNTNVEVKLSDGRVLDDKKFIGFADFGNEKVPYEFKQWMVLESEQGRTFIKPGAVRVITETKTKD